MATVSATKLPTGDVTARDATADMDAHDGAMQVLTLTTWIESLQTEGRAPRCPSCGADGEWDRWEEMSREEVLDLNFDCGSRAQVISTNEKDFALIFTAPPQSTFYALLYEQLVKSCPFFGAPPPPRRRLWRYAR